MKKENSRLRPGKVFLRILGQILTQLLAITINFTIRFLVGRYIANRHYDRPGHFKDDGKRARLKEVQELRVLPLVDWYSLRPALETEAGVAYLVETGETTILFDLGLNGKREAEPPLYRNASRLGIDLARIDFIFNSHPHPDHLGGWLNFFTHRIKLSGEKDPLAAKPLYSTRRITLKGGQNYLVKAASCLAEDVGTTGPLPRQLVMGYIKEQALVVNLAGKGLVVIIGCGHPGVEALVQRAEEVFQTPVYAVIGGFHLLITGDRSGSTRLKPQRLLGSSELPWKIPQKEETYRVIAFLKSKAVELVSVSAHDSCDWSLETFAQLFASHYLPLKVGQEILLAGQPGRKQVETVPV
ncbi:MAG TPA: MBL fold metallo-hydrolase [Chloroflexia bacterium]|nr:MBL fold metallo-hydrolase [Chloroflexia bacterium]